MTGKNYAKIQPWDISYYGVRYKKKFFSIEEDIIAEYFPADHVTQATMDIYQELLGLDFKRLDKAETWHKEVSCYEVKDKKSKQLLGHFYLDLYPRDDKFNHAAAMTLIKRAKVDGKIIPAAAAMVTNFQPPVDDKPSLLPHSDVETFFHEFGHVMHNMCNEANYDKFSGASVEMDFVEMPSQMLENWMWEKEILQKVSKHYKTGKPLPDEMIKMKLKSKNDRVASDTLNQVFLASLDLLLYSASDKNLLQTAAN